MSRTLPLSVIAVDDHEALYTYSIDDIACECVIPVVDEVIT